MRLLRYWGKTGISSKGEVRATHHPLVYHCLDVAACGRSLLERNPLLRDRLAPFAELLRTAEIVHMGKGTTFGLGKVEVAG